MKILSSVGGLCLGLVAGLIGAYSVMYMHDRMGGNLRVRGLEIIDAQNNVRAVLATDESGGGAYLRMQSKTNPAAVNLGVRNDSGTLTFSTSRTNSLVAVGYQPVDDVVDDRRGLWGISVKGPDHQIRAMNAFTLNGIPQEFTFQEAPSDLNSLPQALLPPPSSTPPPQH